LAPKPQPVLEAALPAGAGQIEPSVFTATLPQQPAAPKPAQKIDVQTAA
jgi:hypothetical protein